MNMYHNFQFKSNKMKAKSLKNLNRVKGIFFLSQMTSIKSIKTTNWIILAILFHQKDYQKESQSIKIRKMLSQSHSMYLIQKHITQKKKVNKRSKFLMRQIPSFPSEFIEEFLASSLSLNLLNLSMTTS